MSKEEINAIAKIHTLFQDKFGIPRQSGLVPSLRGEIIFEPAYRSVDAVKGLEEYSHIWLIWGFSKAKRDGFSATVAPPRLGGKIRKGVFATRSPFRPNSLGLSSVCLEEIRMDENLGPIIVVSGADLLDGTPIYDIKPYLPYTDSHPDAKGSFAQEHKEDGIAVNFSENLLKRLPEELQESAYQVLAQDPRAAYNKKPDYVYGMRFGDFDIRFTVEEEILYVKDVVEVSEQLEKIKGAKE